MKSLIKSQTPKSDKVSCIRLFRGKLIFLDALASLDFILVSKTARGKAVLDLVALELVS